MERGLKLFPSHRSARHRQRRLIFAAIYALLILALVWPIYPLASGIHPLIFGLPLSLAYIVFVLLAMFAAKMWLFFGEEEVEPSGGTSAPKRPDPAEGAGS